VVAVATNTLAAEERREAPANGDKLLRDTKFLLGLGLTNDEFADLYHQLVMLYFWDGVAG
jgi:hypothetical protein